MGKLSKKKAVMIEALYAEYLELLNSGKTPTQAIETFSYLHSITLCQLKKRIGVKG